MIAKNATMSSSRQSSKTLEDSLKLSLDSLGASSFLKERLDKTERFPLAYTSCPYGSLTQRDQSKKQKKLNSSVKVSHRVLEERPKNFSLIIPTKPNKLSICRTVSLAYVSQQPRKSRLIPHIRRQTTEYQQLHVKESALQEEFYDKMGSNFTTVKKIIAKCHIDREKQNRNNALIKANDELLKQIRSTEELALANDKIFTNLTKRLEQQHEKCEALKRQLLFLEQDRTRKQEKVAVEQSKNELLVRQINDMKLKLKENLKDLQVLKAEQHDHPTNITRRFLSLD